MDPESEIKIYIIKVRISGIKYEACDLLKLCMWICMNNSGWRKRRGEGEIYSRFWIIDGTRLLSWSPG